MADPYNILGVSSSATEADVKKAFRRLAKKYHPDSNAGNSQAQAKFSEVTQAYEIIGDTEKRAQFDRGEIDGEGKPKHFGFGGGGGGAGGNPFGGGGGPFGGGGRGGNPFGGGGGSGGFRPEDIFSEIFGASQGRGPSQPQPARGTDVHYTVQVGFIDAALGTTERVSLANGRKIDMKVPAGVTDGQQIRLKGQGEAGSSGGPAGDALVKVSVAPSSLFTREGYNIRADLPITLYEAVLGASMRAPTLEGQVNLKIPANTSSGKVLRLKGKGIARENPASPRGDLLYVVKIILPENSDDSLEKLMTEWQEDASYTPRGDEFSNNS